MPGGGGRGFFSLEGYNIVSPCSMPVVQVLASCLCLMCARDNPARQYRLCVWPAMPVATGAAIPICRDLPLQ